MSVPRAVRAVIVDDEPLAREQLAMLLATETDIEIVGEAGGATAAAQIIRESAPDLVFLDVQMPGGDGFDVLRALDAPLPAVIFVTAHVEHAIQAFEFAAIDYLLKPVAQHRLSAAVRRAVANIRNASAGEVSRQLSALLERIPGPKSERWPIWTNGTVVFVRHSDIDWIEAADDHVRIRAGRGTHVSRDTMTNVETRLAHGFVRIHRSTIVNVERIREIQPWVKGDYVVIMNDGTKFTTGRAYQERVRGLLR